MTTLWARRIYLNLFIVSPSYFLLYIFLNIFYFKYHLFTMGVQYFSHFNFDYILLELESTCEFI
jgi:hypothetical protein